MALLATPLADPGRRDDTDSASTVIVWDSREDRLPLVTGLVRKCGAWPRRLQRFSTVAEVQGSRGCRTALVALGSLLSSGSSSLDVIGALKQRGFKIIAYEEGADSWPLRIRCKPLLAGSVSLLDSGSVEFAEELRRSLAQILRMEAERLEDDARVNNLMKELGIVGESEPMMAVFRAVIRISRVSDASALITGETGTGKELLALAIHTLDAKRRSGPFVALNCGAISPGLAEAELFGHRRGAFTGADRDRKGLFRAAQGGVLFLDEIGELEGALQTKLLRVLQENRVLAVGAEDEMPIDVRVIAASNRDLSEMVDQRKFRADLFHRLNVLLIHVPPLRERPADIRPLIEHFVHKNQILNPAAARSVRTDFVEAVSQLALPGNARQLENLVRRALLDKDHEGSLSLGDLPPDVWRELVEERTPATAEPQATSEASNVRTCPDEPWQSDSPNYLEGLLKANAWNLSRSLTFCEKSMLEVALRLANGNHSQTARLLGITARTVYNKVHQHHLDR